MTQENKYDKEGLAKSYSFLLEETQKVLLMARNPYNSYDISKAMDKLREMTHWFADALQAGERGMQQVAKQNQPTVTSKTKDSAKAPTEVKFRGHNHVKKKGNN